MLSDSIPASSARVIAALSTRSLLSGMRGFAFAPVFLAIRVHLDNLHRTWETYAVRLRRNQNKERPVESSIAVRSEPSSAEDDKSVDSRAATTDAAERQAMKAIV